MGLENTGAVDGKGIIQVYVRDAKSEVKLPLKELKNFLQVALAAGKKTDLIFYISRIRFFIFGFGMAGLEV